MIGSEQRRWDDLPLVDAGRHYPNAPIIEAVIEIRCDLPATTTLDALQAVVDPAEFPIRDQTVNVTGLLQVGPGDITGSTTAQPTGHVFRQLPAGQDGPIVQSRLDGFSYSCAKPYENWATFEKAAEAHWLRYREVANAQRAVRLGVRYINEIKVEQTLVEVSDYLRTGIELSPYLPQLMYGYLMQVSIPMHRFDGATATITSQSSTPEPGLTSIILDIDAWRMVDVDLRDGASSGIIKTGLETLRDCKNWVFEACITDATRRMIQ